MFDAATLFLLAETMDNGQGYRFESEYSTRIPSIRHFEAESEY